MEHVVSERRVLPGEKGGPRRPHYATCRHKADSGGELSGASWAMSALLSFQVVIIHLVVEYNKRS